MKHTVLAYPGLGEPSTNRSNLLISSIKVEEVGSRHDRVVVWNRGGMAGELLVKKGDGMPIAQALATALLGEDYTTETWEG